MWSEQNSFQIKLEPLFPDGIPNKVERNVILTDFYIRREVQSAESIKREGKEREREKKEEESVCMCVYLRKSDRRKEYGITMKSMYLLKQLEKLSGALISDRFR